MPTADSASNSTGTSHDAGLIPRHVAIIMDGNGRWAAQRDLPRGEGHKQGVSNIRRVVALLAERGVSVVTLYAFSTENWRRPTEEVDGLMQILAQEIEPQTRDLHEAGVRLVHLGDPEPLATALQTAIARAQQVTRNNTGPTLNVAFNYGGRGEILQAVRRILADGLATAQQLPALAGRLQRVLSYPGALAGPGRYRAGPGSGGLPPAAAAVRSPGLAG